MKQFLMMVGSIAAFGLASQACSSDDTKGKDDNNDAGSSSGGSSSGGPSSGGSSSGGSSSGGAGGQRCEDAAERLQDKIGTCISTSGSSTSTSTTVECTLALAESTEKVANCYDAAECKAISGEDAAAARALAECLQ